MSGDEELQELTEELAELEAAAGSNKLNFGTPDAKKQEGMFKFFKEILHLPESWKVGNLKDEEIGKPTLSIRANLELAAYLKEEGWDKVADFFTTQADIVAAPTMGRKGFMAQLFVTQIRKDHKVASPTAKKKRWFGGGNQDETSQE